MRILVLVIGFALCACGDGGSSGGDAATDAGLDGGWDAGRDAGPPCDPPCGPGFLCCSGECVDVNGDTANCGACGYDCIEREEGTHCRAGSCVCGSNVTGCPGPTVCCPPRTATGMPYCADFNIDADDCGGCDQPCDPTRADRCDGARCLCGDGSRRQCDGTPEDMCCADLLGASQCVDTTSNRAHCGGCGNRCDPGLRCVDGECVEA